MGSSDETTQSIRSIPALAAAIRETHSRAWPTSSADRLRKGSFSSLYRIQAKSSEAEVRAVAHLVGEVAERMRRLGDAYSEWEAFDPSAYFDLTKAQAAQLVHVRERINTVYVAFFIDPLLPSFQQAEAFWANHFFPAYHAAHAGADLGDDGSHQNSSLPSDSASLSKRETRNGSDPSKRPVNNTHKPQNNQPDSAFTADFAGTIFPEMAEHWNQLIETGHQVRRILADHIGYLAVNGSQEERGRWRGAWVQPSPVMEQYSDLCPDYRTIPTLSLSIEFPLPVYRQPGRQQRLRLNRQRRRSSRG